VIDEAHVAELRRPRFERLRARATANRPGPAATPHSVVPWPLAPVEQRDIAAYAEVVGGAR
jgi:hypothetical protein